MKAKAKRIALYARVSTDGQSTDNQLDELRKVAEYHGWSIVSEYDDTGNSGAMGRDERPQFDALLRDAARRKCDMIAAWSTDRLSRSLAHLVAFLGEIQAKGVDLYLHKQAIDTSTPGGKALFQMCGVFAEFERAILIERINAGVRRAKERGTKSGRAIGRPRTDPAVEERIRKMRNNGCGKGKIARELGVGVSVVQRVLATAR
jgi:DNA invertase Pin-like site-specific DNA recombinase